MKALYFPKASHPLVETFQVMQKIKRTEELIRKQQRQEAQAKARMQQGFVNSSEHSLDHLQKALALVNSGLFKRYDFQNQDGNTPLMVLLENEEYTKAGQLYRSTTFVGHNLRNNDGESLLHILCKTPCSQILESCLFRGVSPNLCTNAQKTPAQYAAHYGRLPMLQALKRYGADMTVLTEEGRSLLHIAVKENYIELARWLMKETDISPDLQDKEGKTASDYAHTSDMKFLFALKKQENTASLAAQSGRSTVKTPSPRKRIAALNFGSWQEFVDRAEQGNGSPTLERAAALTSETIGFSR